MTRTQPRAEQVAAADPDGPGRWPDPGTFASGTVELDRSVLEDPPGWLDGGLGPLGVGDEEPRFLLWGPAEVVIGAGVAAWLPLPGGLRGLRSEAPRRSARWLAQLAREKPDGPGPLAVASLPFDPGEPGALVVPRVVLRATPEGRAWLTVVAPRHEGLNLGALAAQVARARPARSSRAAALPSLRWARPDPPEDHFEAQVAEALAAIGRGELRKVVLARRVRLGLSSPPPLASVLRQLHRAEPSSTVFAWGRRTSWFVGATPELVVARAGRQVLAAPLAGTARRPAAPDPSALATTAAALLGSPKERAEHQAVVEAIAQALARHCPRLVVPEAPSPVVLRHVVHLGTRLEGWLPNRPPEALPDALDLLAAVHPTPAVAGVPTELALGVVGRLEAGSRGPYAGPVGWVDAKGDGQFWLGIRSMVLEGPEVVAFAGAGIVAGSTPRAELAETAAKLDTALFGLGLRAEDLLGASHGPAPMRDSG
ncbi:isochorismate synthase [Aciditerrimonas ferrireducens]|nr:isochorismate synthase [Aciditerrimonas ferrireducens]MCK4177189.1 isochorismate synthase [Aciditerrimonas ferrireducens]